MQQFPVDHVSVVKWTSGNRQEKADLLAVEEPLEIRMTYGPEEDRIEKSLTVTMRTPGYDLELTVGFLLSEGIIKSEKDILRVFHCEQVTKEEERGNVVKVFLHPDIPVNLNTVERNFYTASSCGVCGKASIDALAIHCSNVESRLAVSGNMLVKAPELMRKQQAVFEHTGGLHAAALFDKNGELVEIREDIGRHNALDKLIGAALTKKLIPLSEYFIMVSGRIGFELIQKTVAAGCPVLGAVGAPSNLARKVAENYGVTLVGFIKKDSFNIYTHKDRIQ